MKEQFLNTFQTNTGSIDEQIKRATGLPSSQALLDAMANKPDRQVRDILIETPCNQSCIACFFKEYGGPGYVRMSPEALTELRTMADIILDKDPRYYFLYPKEITTSPSILPVMAEQGIVSSLTNGKLLNKPGVIEALKNARIRNLTITVPGSKSAYEFYTKNKPDEYDTLLSNITLAVRSNFDVSIFMPIFAQNIDDIEQTVATLGEMNVKKIQFIRMSRFGDGYSLPDEYFMTQNDMYRFLDNINRARNRVGNAMSLTLFGGSFGPNFFGSSIYRQLACINPKWPTSKYFCPMIDRQYVGISFATKKAYSCFIGMSFEEAQIGYYKDGKITYTKPPLTADDVKNNLRGMCSKDNCEYQPLCLGGCRMNAFVLAKRNGEEDPFFAPQDLCITNTLQNLD